MATGPGLQLGLILRLNNQATALGCWGRRGSTRLNSATVQVRAFTEARWRSSHSYTTSDSESNSGFVPYSSHPVELFTPGKQLVHNTYINTYTSTLPRCLSSPTLSKANTNHPERGLLGSPPRWTLASCQGFLVLVLLETPWSQQTSFKWQHWVLA